MRKPVFVLAFFLTGCSLFSLQVALTLKTTRGDKIQYVDANITRLHYIKDYTIRIEGLNQLKSLEVVVFDMMGFMDDFSFLKDAPWIKAVFIRGQYDSYTDLSFVEHLPGLEILFIGGGRETSITLDLKNNQSLEYLALEYMELESFPVLENMPRTLKYLNLSGNKIRFLPRDYHLYKNTVLFLMMNPYEDRKYANIIFDRRPDEVLGEKYDPFTYID
jgi:hypothetical protein